MNRRATSRPHAGLLSDVEHRLCPYGNCDMGLSGGRVLVGMGPVGCPCDLTPGWRSPHYEGMGKPHPPVLPKGRRGSRVHRARRRHQVG